VKVISESVRLSPSLLRCGVVIKAPLEKSHSTGADEGTVALSRRNRRFYCDVLIEYAEVVHTRFSQILKAFNGH